MFQVLHGYGNTNSGYPVDSAVVILRLAAEQQVWVEPSGIDPMLGANSIGMRFWFSAYLVHAI